VVNTLQGACRDIHIRVDELDFDREYTHENPFPANSASPDAVNSDFILVFQRINGFLNS